MQSEEDEREGTLHNPGPSHALLDPVDFDVAAAQPLAGDAFTDVDKSLADTSGAKWSTASRNVWLSSPSGVRRRCVAVRDCWSPVVTGVVVPASPCARRRRPETAPAESAPPVTAPLVRVRRRLFPWHRNPDAAPSRPQFPRTARRRDAELNSRVRRAMGSDCIDRLRRRSHGLPASCRLGGIHPVSCSWRWCTCAADRGPVEVIVLAKVNEGTAEGANTDRKGACVVRVRPDMDAMEV